MGNKIICYCCWYFSKQNESELNGKATFLRNKLHWKWISSSREVINSIYNCWRGRIRGRHVVCPPAIVFPGGNPLLRGKRLCKNAYSRFFPRKISYQGGGGGGNTRGEVGGGGGLLSDRIHSFHLRSTESLFRRNNSAIFIFICFISVLKADHFSQKKCSRRNVFFLSEETPFCKGLFVHKFASQAYILSTLCKEYIEQSALGL